MIFLAFTVEIENLGNITPQIRNGDLKLSTLTVARQDRSILGNFWTNMIKYRNMMQLFVSGAKMVMKEKNFTG